MPRLEDDQHDWARIDYNFATTYPTFHLGLTSQPRAARIRGSRLAGSLCSLKLSVRTNKQYLPYKSRMATLNLSTNGPSISKSYQSIISSPPPSDNAAQSPYYGQWAVFSVSAPLVNAFQQEAGGGGKESILKVQSTGGKWSAYI